MLEQEFSKEKIQKLLRKDDVKKFRLWSNKDDSDSVIKNIYNNLSSKNYQIEFKQISKNGKNVYVTSNVETELITRNLDYIIRRVYKIQQADRDKIVKQLLSILKSSNNYEITKIDISKFYESISSSRLVYKMNDDAILTQDIIDTFTEIFEATSINSLPRGLSISASLSELFMRSFDSKVRRMNGVVYFARYVDDVIIITMPGCSSEVKKIKELIKDLSLEINPIKQSEIQTTKLELRDEFDYLGYLFKIHKRTNKAESREVRVSIAKSKVKKIQKRLCLACVDYIKNNDFELLEKRIKLLTSNYPLVISENGILKSGIYYNYKLIDKDCKSLINLNYFLKQLLSGGNRLSLCLLSKLSAVQISRLKKFCFVAGFEKAIVVKYSRNELIRIHKCWKYA